MRNTLQIFMNVKFIAKSNYLLRKVLNSKDSLDILQDLIESILKIKIEKITLNPYLKQRKNELPTEENFGIADVRILTKENEEMNVGLQFIDGKYVETKLLLYYAQIHTNQLYYKHNKKIAKTTTINFLNQNYYDTFSYHKKIHIKTKKIENEDEEEIILNVIELEKFQPIFLHNLNKEEQWMTYFKGDNQEEVERVKRMNYKINKLDFLIEDYWKNEKME